VGDCGGESEEFFWPGGGEKVEKVPDTFLVTFLVAASQVTGTREVSDGEGGTTQVPFRGNEATSGSVDVSSSGTYSYRQTQLGQTQIDTDSQSSGITTRKTGGSSRSSSYTGIAGEYEGFSLTKSQSSGNENTTVRSTNDNGDVERSGTFSNSSVGSSDSLTVVSSDDTNTSGSTTTTTSSSSRASSGSNASETSQGVFSEDSSGTSQTGTANSAGKGYSRSTTTATRSVSVDANSFSSFSSSTNTTNTKAQTDGSAQGTFQREDGVLKNQVVNSQSDSSSRVDTSGNSFETSKNSVSLFGTTVQTFNMAGSGGTSRATNNSSGTDVTRRTEDETTSRGTASSDYSANQRTNGFSGSSVSTKTGSTTLYVETLSSGNSNSSTTGGGSGTTNRDADSNDYAYQVNSSNNGNTSSRTSITTGSTSDNRSSSETISRTDSADGSSSFNGDISRTNGKYSRSGDISRSTNGSAGIELTARSNSTSANARSWTITTAGIESSQEFSLSGQLTEKNGSSTLSGDVSVSNTSGSSSSGTVGSRGNLDSGNTTGYKQQVVTNGNSSSLTKTASGSVTIKDGETKLGKQSLTQTTKDTTSIATDVEKRTQTTSAISENSTRYDLARKRTNTVTDTVTDGDPTFTEDRAYELDITDETESTRDWEDNQGEAYTRKITDTTITNRNDTTSYSLTGGNESLSIENDKTVSRKKTVKDGRYDTVSAGVGVSGSGTANQISFSGIIQVGDPVSISRSRTFGVRDYTLTDKKVATSSYIASQSVDGDGVVSGGKLTSSSEVTTAFEVSGKSKISGELSSESITIEISEKRTTSNKTNENGSYSDQRTANGEVMRVSSGEYTEESSTESTVEGSLLYDAQGSSSSEGRYETEIKIEIESTQNSEKKIQGSYGPAGGKENVTEESRRSTAFISEVEDLYASDGSGGSITVDDEKTWRSNSSRSLNSPLSGTVSRRTSFLKKGSGFTSANYDEWLNNETTSLSDYRSFDLFENAETPQQTGSRNTGGSTGEVFAFVAGQASSPQLQVIADRSNAANGVAGTLPVVVVRPPARAGSVTGGETDYVSVWGAFLDHFWDGPSDLATGVGNSLGTTVDAVLDPIGTLRNFKDTGGLILQNLFTRNPLDNIRDVAQGVGGYVQEQWDKGLVGLGELIGDAAQGYAGAKLLRKFGRARNGTRVVDEVAPNSAARPFTQRLADYNQNPGAWRPQSIHAEPATSIRARGGVSEQIIYRNSRTGETLVRHRVTDARGRVLDDHFRPNYKPRIGEVD